MGYSTQSPSTNGAELDSLCCEPGNQVSRRHLPRCHLKDNNVGLHLHWVDKSPSGGGYFTLTAKMEINGQMLLLRTRTRERSLIDSWEVNDPTFHTNARLVAFDRIMTDPENEDILLSI